MNVPTRTLLRALAVMPAAALLIAGCGGSDAPAQQAEPSTTSAATADAANEPKSEAQATTEETTTEEVEYATENQVASVIAGYEADWREVIEGAGSCRFLYVLDDDLSPAEDVERTTCYLSETTIGTQAAIVTRDIEALDVPPSMTDLVDETLGVLASLHEPDLEEACGAPFDGPGAGSDCDEVLGQRMFAYSRLETLLDKWGPYTG